MEKLINHEKCEEVIRNLLNKDEVKIFNFHVILHTGDYPGFCADYCRLKIDFENLDGKQQTKVFFVKALPITNQKKREFIMEFGVFKKEAHLVKYLLPELTKYSEPNKWCPSFYLVRDDLLIMEDLTSSGFEMMPTMFEYTPSHLFEALKTLAIFHAAGIAYDQQQLKTNGTNMGEKYKSMLFQTIFVDDNLWTRSGFKAVKAVVLNKTKYGIGSAYEKIVKDSLIASMNKTFQICEDPKTKVPFTWIHQDLWNNNLMFKYDGSKDYSKPKSCLVLDFGLSCYFPLTIDVLMVIFLCSNTQQRKQMLEPYLKFYFDNIQTKLYSHNLINLFSWNDFQANCQEFILIPLVLRCLYLASTFLPSELFSRLSENDEEAYKKLVMIDRDQEVLETMDNDEKYRSLLTEAAEELVEFLFVH